MKTKPFSELRKQMTPERRAKNKTRAQIMLLHLTLLELQESLGLTNDDLKTDLSAVESTLCELENQEDIQVSSLSRYIKALGGNLKLVANFPDEEIVLAQFE
ncbi:transcriptional regulator [Westiellopsis prolifica IICB1]|nr:transcriptional regulator [Westiellopsis prolifica IICB1]